MVDHLELNRAIVDGDLERLEEIFEKFKIDPNLLIFGATLLCTAVQGGHLKVVDFLIGKGAGVNIRIKDKISPLHVAAYCCHADIVEYLIAQKADVAAVTQDSHFTALHTALKSNEKNEDVIKVAKILIEKGLDIEAKAKFGLTPLHSVMMISSIYKKEISKLVEYLLELKADINARAEDGSTPLHIAAQYGHADIVEILIKKGAEIEAKTNSGFTPLHAAMKSTYTTEEDLIKVLRVLFNGKVDYNACVGGYNALHLATQYGRNEIVKVLIESGIDIECKTNSGSTPLHIATRYCHFEIVKTLIERGASIEAKTNSGLKPLQIAVTSENADEEDLLEIIKLLIANKATQDSVGGQGSPLCLAIKFERWNIVKTLVTESKIDHNNFSAALFLAQIKGGKILENLLSIFTEAGVAIEDIAKQAYKEPIAAELPPLKSSNLLKILELLNGNSEIKNIETLTISGTQLTVEKLQMVAKIIEKLSEKEVNIEQLNIDGLDIITNKSLVNAIKNYEGKIDKIYFDFSEGSEAQKSLDEMNDDEKDSISFFKEFIKNFEPNFGNIKNIIYLNRDGDECLLENLEADLAFPQGSPSSPRLLDALENENSLSL